MISLFFFVSWLDFNSVDQFDCSYVYVWTFSTLAIPFEWLCEYVWISSFLLLMLSYTLDPFHYRVLKLTWMCTPLSLPFASSFAIAHIYLLLCMPFHHSLYWPTGVHVYVSHACVLIPHFHPWSICINMYAFILLPISCPWPHTWSGPCSNLPTIHEVFDFARLYICHTRICMHWIHICVKYPSMLGYWWL